MDQRVEQAKAEFDRATGRLKHLLDKTPDDKLTWSPTPTCRSAVQIVGHSAVAIGGIQSMLEGAPNPLPADTAEIDAMMRGQEKEFTSREQVVGLLDGSAEAYDLFLDSLTLEQLESIADGPFGPMPVSAAIMFPTMHTRAHCAQLEYLQTVYGDHDWHY